MTIKVYNLDGFSYFYDRSLRSWMFKFPEGSGEYIGGKCKNATINTIKFLISKGCMSYVLFMQEK